MKRWLVLLAACRGGDGERHRNVVPKGPFVVQRIADGDGTTPTPSGLSGLAVDDHDVLWVVPDKERWFVRLTLDGKVTIYPMVGFPVGVDTEGLAWLGPNKFAVSTESPSAKVSLIYAELRDGQLVATKTRTFSGDDLGVQLEANKGAEGACGFGDDVIIGIETTGTLPDGTRFAPIARVRGDAVTFAKVMLTSETGKLSALDCTIDPDGTAHVWAIERHFDICHILRFDLPLGATRVTPRVTLDLGPSVRGTTLNLEGIVQLHDGRLAVINDNDYGGITDPNELFIFEPGAGTR